MNERIHLLARLEASKSVYRFRLGAVIFRRDKVLGRGFNTPNKTHPQSLAPYKTRCAEFNSYINAVNLGISPNKLQGASLYVHRIKKDGSPGLAKPCEFCKRFLDQVGIKDIQYSR